MLAREAWTGGIAPEERLRAHQYQLLARWLAAPPEKELLDLAAGFAGDDTEFGRALGELGGRARQATPEGASREYHELFIGIGRGELVPYASYYLTGFLNEKPLSKLRSDMARLGIWRPGRRCSSTTWKRRNRRASTLRSARSAGCSWASRRPPS